MPLRIVRDDETPQRRDPFGVGLGLGMISLGIYAMTIGGWAWLIAGALLLIGVPGLIESLMLTERDRYGRTIRPEKEKNP